MNRFEERKDMVDIYPYKSQFQLHDSLELVIESETEDNAELVITFLGKEIEKIKIQVVGDVQIVKLQNLNTCVGGYGVTLIFSNGTTYHTAFDIVDDKMLSIRYGFLSDFSTGDGEEARDVEWMRKLHINMVQFYDWSYRHDHLVGETDKYSDMMGRKVDKRTVFHKIEACHKYGMKAMGYGAIYAASKEFYDSHKEWGMYTVTGKPLDFIHIFYLMNVSKECGWRKHLIKEYLKALKEMEFDGIHMDTYGFPKTAFASDGEYLKMEEIYPDLINETYQKIKEAGLEPYLIFNNVGNWPVKETALAKQDAVYIEVWNPYDTYQLIKQIILDAKKACKNEKAIILAAYLEPFKPENHQEAIYNELLITAVTTSNGATHLVLGENHGILTQGYYVDHSILTDKQERVIRTYYDFLVEYKDLFYDASLQDVGMTHCGWDNTEYRVDKRISTVALPDKVWGIMKENYYRKVISLINLCGCHNTKWNEVKEKPVSQDNLWITIQLDRNIQRIYYISPDIQRGKAQTVNYETVETERGREIRVQLPTLLLWGNLVIDLQ